jgi:hypothetical protein
MVINAFMFLWHEKGLRPISEETNGGRNGLIQVRWKDAGWDEERVCADIFLNHKGRGGFHKGCHEGGCRNSGI